MTLSGIAPSDIAAELGISRQAVHKHLNKRAEELSTKKQLLVDAVVDNWITDKKARLERLRLLADKTLEEVDEYGITIVEEVMSVGKDGTSTTVKTRDYRASLVRELRGLLSDAADELGQKPRPPVIVNNDNRTQILVRQVAAPDNVELG